ncbi:MAG TPA: peptide ABC transporter substrate-binding protein [Chloroflexota bacterium]
MKSVASSSGLLIALLAACGGTAAPASSSPPAAASGSAAAKASPAASATPKRGGTVKVGIWQEPAMLNPILNTQTITSIVAYAMLDGLAPAQPDGTYGPGLATQVPTKENGGVSADGLTVTYKLKSGVLWSDGQPFTGKDVAFTYKVIMNNANPVINRTGYTDIDSVTTPDDSTVVVKFKKLYAGYRGLFDWILPEHAFNGDSNIDKKEYNRAPIGTGPFVLKEWKSGDTITLVRNEKYREQGKPYLDGLIFKVMPSREAEIQAYKVGDIDVMWNMLEANIPDVDKIPDSLSEPAPGSEVERLVLNTSCPSGPQQGDPKCPHPILGDPKVRQAIELAIDKKAIVDKLLFGKTTVASSVIPLGWYAPKLNPSEFNLAKAKQLLDEAGWKPGADGVRVKDGVRAHLTFSTTTGDQLREQTQQVIQEMLKGVGIELEIKNQPSPVLLGSWAEGAPRAKGNFDIIMYTTNADLDPQAHLANYFGGDQVPSEQTKSGRNYHRIIDPELDKALNTASSTLDESARKDAYKTVAERIAEDRGHIVLYNRLRIDPHKTYVNGVRTNVWKYLGWDTENWWLSK